jgi:hypothetical protein
VLSARTTSSITKDMMATDAKAPAIQESPEALARMAERIIGERNARGIPSAFFVVRIALRIVF